MHCKTTGHTKEPLPLGKKGSALPNMSHMPAEGTRGVPLQAKQGGKLARPVVQRQNNRPHNDDNLDSNNGPSLQQDTCRSYQLSHNFVTVELDGTNYHAKVDTGADQNFISSTIIQKLSTHLKNKFRPNKQSVICANQTTSTTLGCITLPFPGVECRYSFPFIYCTADIGSVKKTDWHCVMMNSDRAICC